MIIINNYETYQIIIQELKFIFVYEIIRFENQLNILTLDIKINLNRQYFCNTVD